MSLTGKSKDVVTIYSRHGCHLCDVALETLQGLQEKYHFDIDIKYIDGNQELEKKYGEQIPVTLINGTHHDFWRVDKERFISSLEKSRQNQ